MQNSIRTRLITGFIGLALGPLLLVGLILAWQSASAQQTQALALQGEIAQRAAVQATAFITELENELRLIIQVQDLPDLDPDEQRIVMSRLQSHKHVFEELTLLDSQGQERVRVSRTSSFTTDKLDAQSQAAEFLMTQTSDKTYYSSVSFDQATGEPFIIMAVPIIDVRSGRVDGGLVANIRLKEIWDLIANIHVGEAGIAYIVDQQGRVVAHSDPSLVLKGTYFNLPPDQEGPHIGLNGTYVILARAKIPLGQQTLHIVTERSIIEALALTIRTLLIIGILLVIALGTAGIFGFLTVRQIVWPIESLAAAAAQIISTGNLSQQVEVSSSDELGILANTFNIMATQLQQTIDSLEQLVTERTEVAKALASSNAELEETIQSLQVSEARNQALVNAIPDIMFRLNTNGLFLDFKAEQSQLLMPAEEIIGIDISETPMPANVVEAIMKFVRLATETNEVQYYEYELQMPNGVHTYEARIVKSSSDEVVCIVRDITERKQAEERIKASLQEKEILLKEIHHRVKNNLQIISSLLKFQARYIDDEQTITLLQESQSRVRSMTLIHEKLYQSQDLARVNFAEYIRSLTTHLFHSYAAHSIGITLRLDVGDILLDVDTGVPCGLIINELVSNSLKYAFPAGGAKQTREIYVDMQMNGNRQLILTVADNGIGLPPDFDFHDTESLGLQLVNMLVDQIEGTIVFDSSAGVTAKITFQDNNLTYQHEWKENIR